jgi:site-specific DNA recombinase
MPTIPTRTKAIGYIRVSTDKQVDHGISLEAQKAKLEAYAALYDIDLVEVIVDAGVSAKTLERPGLQQALGMMKKGTANALLICKLDRLSRSVKDFATLIEKYFASDKFTLLSVTDSIDTRSAAGRLVLHVLMSVAEWERATISERTTEALAHKKACGERTGGIPYGFTVAADGKTLVPDAAEQDVIVAIRSYRQEGLSLRRICAIVHRQGIRTRKGTAFSVTQICRILRAS